MCVVDVCVLLLLLLFKSILFIFQILIKNFLVKMAAEGNLSEYEKARLANIAENAKLLKYVGPPSSCLH